MSACPKCLRYDAWDGATCACCDNPGRHPPLRRLEMNPRLIGSLAAFYWAAAFWYGLPVFWMAAVLMTAMSAVAVYDRATGHRVLDWLHGVEVRAGRDAEWADEAPTGEGPGDPVQAGHITTAEPPAHPAGSLRVPGPADRPVGTTPPARRRPGDLGRVGDDPASTPPPHARVAPGWRRFVVVLALSLTAGGLTAWATWTAWWWIVGGDTR